MNLSVRHTDIDQEITVTPAVQITGSLLRRNASGEVAPVAGAACRFWTDDIPDAHLCAMNADGTFRADVVPGTVQLELEGIPPDTYFLTAVASGENTSPRGIGITRDTELHIVLAAGGSVVEGVAQDASGAPLPEATVVVVPDPPARDVGVLYRSAVAEADGRFQIRGVAPGAYHLYAWYELNGAAYRNAEFMEEFNDRGIPILIEKGPERVSRNIVAF